MSPPQPPSLGRRASKSSARGRDLQRRYGANDLAIYPIKVTSDTATLTTGDGQFVFEVTSADHIAGMRLLEVAAYVTTVSSSGLPTVQVRNVTGAVDMLTTPITIDASEYSSDNAATAAVIDTSNDGVALGDRIAIDVDVAGTGAKGLGVILAFGR